MADVVRIVLLVLLGGGAVGLGHRAVRYWRRERVGRVYELPVDRRGTALRAGAAGVAAALAGVLALPLLGSARGGERHLVRGAAQAVAAGVPSPPDRTPQPAPPAPEVLTVAHPAGGVLERLPDGTRVWLPPRYASPRAARVAFPVALVHLPAASEADLFAGFALAARRGLADPFVLVLPTTCPHAAATPFPSPSGPRPGAAAPGPSAGPHGEGAASLAPGFGVLLPAAAGTGGAAAVGPRRGGAASSAPGFGVLLPQTPGRRAAARAVPGRVAPLPEAAGLGVAAARGRRERAAFPAPGFGVLLPAAAGTGAPPAAGFRREGADAAAPGFGVLLPVTPGPTNPRPTNPRLAPVAPDAAGPAPTTPAAPAADGRTLPGTAAPAASAGDDSAALAETARRYRVLTTRTATALIGVGADAPCAVNEALATTSRYGAAAGISGLYPPLGPSFASSSSARRPSAPRPSLLLTTAPGETAAQASARRLRNALRTRRDEVRIVAGYAGNRALFTQVAAYLTEKLDGPFPTAAPDPVSAPTPSRATPPARPAPRAAAPSPASAPHPLATHPTPVRNLPKPPQSR